MWRVALQRGEILDGIRLERPRAVHTPVLRIEYTRLHGILNSLRKYAGMHTPAYNNPAGLDATPEQVTRWLRAFTLGDIDEGFLGLPLMELTTPVAYLSAHTRFIRWVTTLRVAQHLPDAMNPGTSSLRLLKVLQASHKLLTDSGLNETDETDDDGRESQGQKPAPTLVPLAELPSSDAESQDDFPTQRQLARHLSRHSGPVACRPENSSYPWWQRRRGGGPQDRSRMQQV